MAIAVKKIPEKLIAKMRAIFNEYSGADINSCWEWKRSKNPRNGYGQINCRCNGKSTLFTAHRVSLTAVEPCNGENVYALHKCDNRACINPAHLYWGTIKNNARDMVQRSGIDFKARALRGDKHWSNFHKGVLPRGVDNKKSKLTDEAVRYIRTSNESGLDLAKRYGVSQAAISSVRLNKTWKHVSA